MSAPPVLSAVLVEDNPVSRAVLRGILRDHRVEVVGESRGGEHALELVREHKPDLVCLDIMLPDTDGIELLKLLRAEFSATPVVMVSGASEPERVRDAFANGAAGFVVKPFSPGAVMSAVERACGRIGAKNPPARAPKETKTA